MKTSTTLLCALLAAASAPLADAQLIAIVNGDETAVSTKFTFTVDPVNYRLTVDVDNTFDTGVTGTVTAFGFNVPGDGTGVSLFSQVWTLNPTNHSETAWTVSAPFQVKNQAAWKTEVGGDTDGNGGGGNGGNPNNGVKFGDKTTFVFQLPAFDVSQINAFYQSDPDLVVRWQEVVGAGNQTSDRGRGNFEEPTPPLDPVPEPSTYGLMGAAALAALAIYRRKRR